VFSDSEDENENEVDYLLQKEQCLDTLLGKATAALPVKVEANKLAKLKVPIANFLHSYLTNLFNYL
jgi:hypothetical protein